MILSHMIRQAESALVCDLAETYHIYDMRQFEAEYIATLACGLRSGARIMSLIANVKTSSETTLLAGILDALRILVWQNTRDGAKGKNQPKMILEALYPSEKKSKVTGFASAEDFEAARTTLLKGE